MCGEAVPIEHFADECGDRIVGELQCVALSFERGRCEEATVEERDVAERAGGLGALGWWRVEGSEEERAEESMMELSAEFECVDRSLQEEVPIAVEPSFRFEEREEEAP